MGSEMCIRDSGADSQHLYALLRHHDFLPLTRFSNESRGSGEHIYYQCSHPSTPADFIHPVPDIDSQGLTTILRPYEKPDENTRCLPCNCPLERTRCQNKTPGRLTRCTVCQQMVCPNCIWQADPQERNMVCRAHIPAINRPQRLDQIPREHTVKKTFGDDTPKHYGFRGTGMFHYMPGTKKSRLHSKMKADSEETSEPEAEITGFSATGLPAGTVVTDELREKTSSTIRSEMTERSGLRTRDCDSGDGETQQELREKARGVAARWFSGGPPAFREGPLSEPVAPEGQDHQEPLTAEERAEQFLESATLIPAIDGDTLVVGPGVDGLVLTIPAGRDALQEEYERSRQEAAREAMTHSGAQAEARSNR